MLECWLGEEWLEKSNCIGGAVFGAIIKGCATCGGVDVGGAIVDGDHGRIMVSIAIAGGAIEQHHQKQRQAAPSTGTPSQAVPS